MNQMRSETSWNTDYYDLPPLQVTNGPIATQWRE